MARFVNFEIIEKAIDQLKEVYYIDDDNKSIFFSSIHYEQLTLKAFEKRFPDKDPKETVEIIKRNESKGKIYTSLTVTSCIQDVIDELGLVGYIIDKKGRAKRDQNIDPDSYPFKFGKYTGSSVKSISKKDINYLKWIIGSEINDDTLKAVCKFWLEHEKIEMPTGLE